MERIKKHLSWHKKLYLIALAILLTLSTVLTLVLTLRPKEYGIPGFSDIAQTWETDCTKKTAELPKGDTENLYIINSADATVLTVPLTAVIGNYYKTYIISGWNYGEPEENACYTFGWTAEEGFTTAEESPAVYLKKEIYKVKTNMGGQYSIGIISNGLSLLYTPPALYAHNVTLSAKETNYIYIQTTPEECSDIELKQRNIPLFDTYNYYIFNSSNNAIEKIPLYPTTYPADEKAKNVSMLTVSFMDREDYRFIDNFNYAIKNNATDWLKNNDFLFNISNPMFPENVIKIGMWGYFANSLKNNAADYNKQINAKSFKYASSSIYNASTYVDGYTVTNVISNCVRISTDNAPIVFADSSDKFTEFTCRQKTVPLTRSAFNYVLSRRQSGSYAEATDYGNRLRKKFVDIYGISSMQGVADWDRFIPLDAEQLPETLFFYLEMDTTRYNVTFNYRDNTGGNTVVSTKAPGGSTISYPDIPTAPHCNFTGWDVSGTVTGDITVSAVYADEEYAISFLHNNNILTTRRGTYYADFKSIVKDISVPTVSGKNFSGWALADNGQILDDTFKVDKNITLYAVYSDAPPGAGEKFINWLSSVGDGFVNFVTHPIQSIGTWLKNLFGFGGGLSAFKSWLPIILIVIAAVIFLPGALPVILLIFRKIIAGIIWIFKKIWSFFKYLADKILNRV